MIGYLLKKLLSFTITILTLFVPQHKYQKLLDELPDISQRVAEKELNGWTFKVVRSEHTNLEHTFFEFPSTDSTAPVLLCLHGFNTDGSVFFNLKSLSDKYRVIAYNFPEKSELYRGTIRDFDLLLDDFCFSAGFDSIVVLGNSVGGGIALHYASSTSRVTIKKLILTSTTVFGTTPQNQHQIRGMADRLLQYPDYKLYSLLVKGAKVLKKVEQPELKKNVPEEGMAIKHVDWYKEILKAFYWYESVGDAANITCPVVVIHGKLDKIMNNREIEATKAAFPSAQMYLLEDAAHSLIFSHATVVDSISRK